MQIFIVNPANIVHVSPYEEKKEKEKMVKCASFDIFFFLNTTTMSEE